MKTGPNNTSGVVWAISEFFFFLSSFFLKLTTVYSVYIIVVYEICDRRGGGGKNNAPGVVWAISEFFFSFFFEY